MDINISKFFREASPRDYSASVAEIGKDAGIATWQAANDDSTDYPMIDDDEKRAAFRAWVGNSGGWSDDEIAAWSNDELNALFIQWVAGDMREGGLDLPMSNDDWTHYAQQVERGTLAGRIFRADDGEIYFSLWD